MTKNGFTLLAMGFTGPKAMQLAAMSGLHSQAEQHDLFIGLCRLLAEPAPSPPSGPNGPELLAFAKACLERRPGARLRALTIRNRLEQWWGVHYPDRPLPTIREVAKMLSKLFERKKGDGGLWFYKGVTFKEPARAGNGFELTSPRP